MSIIKKKDLVDINNLIRNNFKNSTHSLIVLKRAVMSCQIPAIRQYLEKKLLLEPKWENITNIVYGILYNLELPKCKFCNKSLPFSNYLLKKPYCSELCEKTDLNLIDTSVKQTGYETIQKTNSIINRIKKIFKKK